MKSRVSQKRAQLYLRHYPRLVRQIYALVQLVKEQDPNVALLVLYGSTARLEPHAFSDADMLLLLHNPRVIYEIGKTAKVVHLIGEAQIPPDDAWCDWTFSSMLGNAEAGDLDEDFVANVARDGVLLYQQEGVSLPPALAGLQPFYAWQERVNALVAECEQVLAAKASA